VDLAKAREIHAAVLLHPSRITVDDIEGKISLYRGFYKRQDIVPIFKYLDSYSTPHVI
jgi:hypothetical protein